MTTAPKESYPLCWPPGRPRTANPQRSRFKAHVSHTLATVRNRLMNQLRQLGATDVVLSTNLRLRLDGWPLSGQAQPSDAGVAVYFRYKGRETCFACDQWRKVEENIRAIDLTIEALRGIARWGTGDMVDAAFSGFQALPAYTPPAPWRETLGLAAGCTLEQAEEAYRQLAGKHHPDRGGTHERMTAINDAIDRARKELGGRS